MFVINKIEVDLVNQEKLVVELVGYITLVGNQHEECDVVWRNRYFSFLAVFAS